VELDPPERFRAVPDPLVGPVVGVGEPGKPVCREGVLVHRVAVVLGRDETALGPLQDARLVLTPVAVLELVRFRPSR
jgi:hypothetical protein